MIYLVVSIRFTIFMVDNERSSRVRGEITFAEGRLQPTLYFFIRIPHLLNKEMICLIQIFLLSLEYYEKSTYTFVSSPL